jgi:hypothetical protein
MPNVTVTPLSQISVRVGPGAPAAVQSTAQFVGASDVSQYTQSAYNTANNAYNAANTAYTAANVAYAYANTKLSKNGDVMMGDYQVAGNLTPTIENFYTLGTVARPWQSVYVGENSLHIGRTTLSTSNGALIVTSPTGQSTNLSGSSNTANAAFVQANLAFIQANSAYNQANISFAYAGSSFNQANISFNLASNAYAQANAAFATANSVASAGPAFAQANLAFDTANSAFIRANNSIDATTGGTVAGRITISNTTPSTSNTTGALVLAGGLAVSGNVFVDSLTLTSNNFNANAITFDAGLF